MDTGKLNQPLSTVNYLAVVWIFPPFLSFLPPYGVSLMG